MLCQPVSGWVSPVQLMPLHLTTVMCHQGQQGIAQGPIGQGMGSIKQLPYLWNSALYTHVDHHVVTTYLHWLRTRSTTQCLTSPCACCWLLCPGWTCYWGSWTLSHKQQQSNSRAVGRVPVPWSKRWSSWRSMVLCCAGLRVRASAGQLWQQLVMRCKARQYNRVGH